MVGATQSTALEARVQPKLTRFGVGDVRRRGGVRRQGAVGGGRAADRLPHWRRMRYVSVCLRARCLRKPTLRWHLWLVCSAVECNGGEFFAGLLDSVAIFKVRRAVDLPPFAAFALLHVLIAVLSCAVRAVERGRGQGAAGPLLGY